MYGPSLPPELEEDQYGPALPSKDDDDEQGDRNPQYYGPALPHHLQKNAEPMPEAEEKPRRRVMGPAVMPPPGYKPPPLEDEEQIAGTHGVKRKAGDNEDVDDFGPRPPSASVDPEDDLQDRLALIDARARGDTDEKDGSKSDKLQRPSWMLVPPEKKARTPAGPAMQSRTFSKGKGQTDDDMSLWTETPAERLKRLQSGADESSSKKRKVPEHNQKPSAEDEAAAALVKQYNEAHRGKTLVDIYDRDHLSSRMEKADDPSARPFSRELDLNRRKADPNARERMLEKAKELGGRFGHGTQRYYR
ncbi:hypothetical protein BJ742DRAFT_810131 [Cladochytrium replicatum]|nr:hypothetical protein BJ742DRAFT_810131 [Cladochytrium replicatum]